MFDEKFEETLSDEQKKILENFRKDLKERPIRPLTKEEYEIYAGAIFRAQDMLPSFRDALAVLSPFMDATCTTAYTDKYARVGLSYWFFHLADAHTKAMVVLHESMHVLNSHFVRADSMKVKPHMMNYAGDFEINTNLYTLPAFKDTLEDFLIPQKFDLPDFKTFENYVGMLNDKLDDIEKSTGNPDDGSDAIDNASQPNSDGSPQSGDNSNGDSDSGQQQSGESGNSQSSDSSQNSDGGEGSQSNDSGNGSPSDSGSGESGNSGQDQQSGSGYGESYDDYVRKMNDTGENKGSGSGGSSLDDLLNERNNKEQKCNGNHSGQGGTPCDGSCDHDSNDQNQNDSDKGDGNKDSDGSGKESSIDNYKRSIGNNKKKKVSKPTRRCDDSTEKRSQAADDAGISRTSEIEQSIARNNTSARITEELNQGGRGSGSSNEFLKIALNRMLPPKVDWRELFRRAVSNAYSASVMGKSHNSYKRVNRRYSQGSIIFPGTIDHSPKAALGIDTSGSMGNEDFRSILSEIEDIIKNAARQKNSLKVFSVDTTIKGIQPVTSVKNIQLAGGGGTDMSVAFAYINSLEKRDKPDIMILGTDGGTLWESVEKQIRRDGNYHAIILVTQKYEFERVPKSLMSVASVIDISED